MRSEINTFLNKKLSSKPQLIKEDNVDLYYRSQMSSQYRQEEKNLRSIIKQHVIPKEGKSVDLSIYYKSRKVSHLFIKNNIHKDQADSHVVYRYDCPRDVCQQSQFYIGYTTTTLKQRMTFHVQNGAIATHHKDIHSAKTRTADLLENTIILFRSSEKTDLVIAEAVLIKEHCPPLNGQREGETRNLRIF